MTFFKKAFTFDDVALVPQYNNIDSRLEPDLSSWITKNSKIGIPILAANMDTVIDDVLANSLIDHGSYPIFHRFCSLDSQLRWCQKYGNNCYISCGINGLDNLKTLLETDVRGVVVDIAHGHSLRMINLIRDIKSLFPSKEVIAGNVCTPMAYHDLVSAGADAVKVGIGPGAACTTRMVTGFGVPQFTAIYDISQYAKKLKVPIIGDGGIRNSRDVSLALAAGASTVMVGSLFAKTLESANNKKLEILGSTNHDVITQDYSFNMNKVEDKNRVLKFISEGKVYEVKVSKILKRFLTENHIPHRLTSFYRGQSSSHFQNDYYGSLKKGTVAEGQHFEMPCSGSVDDLLTDLLGGLRSALTYGGARNIKEFQRKAEFVEVMSNYSVESNIRK